MRDCSVRGSETFEFSDVKPMATMRVELDCFGVRENIVVGWEHAPNVPKGRAEAAKGFVTGPFGPEQVGQMFARVGLTRRGDEISQEGASLRCGWSR